MLHKKMWRVFLRRDAKSNSICISHCGMGSGGNVDEVKPGFQLAFC